MELLNNVLDVETYDKVSKFLGDIKKQILSEKQVAVETIGEEKVEINTLTFEESIYQEVGSLVLNNIKEKTKLEDIEFLALLKILNTTNNNEINLKLAREDNDIPAAVFSNVMYLLEKNNIVKEEEGKYIVDKEKLCFMYFA